MSIKQTVKNWNTNRIIAKEEREAEDMEIREAVNEAKRNSRKELALAKFEAKKQRAIEFAKSGGYIGRVKRNAASLGKAVIGLASSDSKSGKKRSSGFGGLEIGTGGFDLGVGSGLDLGFGSSSSSRKGKGKKKRKEKFSFF
jgi:hypothetical protein